MNQSSTFLPARQRRGHPFPLLRALAPLLMLALLITSAPPAFADGCGGCKGPTLTDLQGESDFQIRVRFGWLGLMYPDYYKTDRGECVSKAAGKPVITRLRTWLVLRGQGEVWDCPHSKSADTITITTSEADSTSWTLKAMVGVELSGVGSKVKAQVEKGQTTGVTIVEVTSVSKTITPGWCHRVAWAGYFEVAEFQATAAFTHRQRWAWWTKNTTTGATVHASGDIWMNCGSTTVTLTREAPISGYFDLSQKGCADARCYYVVEKHLGLYPELPPYLLPPSPSSNDDPNATSDEGDTNPDTGDEPSGEPLSSGELGEPPTGPLPNPLGNG